MHAPLHDEIHSLALEIANASGSGKNKLAGKAYLALQQLCESNEGGDQDHPLQWEALGDFAENHTQALAAYEKGLSCAITLELAEHIASIKLAMAECYAEQGNIQEAYRLATEAASASVDSEDDSLKAAISEFLSDIE